jgi:hypothetical protein
MRAARTTLVAVLFVLGVAFVVPSRWLRLGQKEVAADSTPRDVTSWALFSVSGCFLLAGFFRRLRPRWGWRDGLGATWTRSGSQTFGETARAPRMSAVTCYGLAVGFAGMAWLMGPQNTWAKETPLAVGPAVSLAGFVIAIFGRVFTKGRGVTIITNPRTGKILKRGGYYEEL